MPTRLEAAVSEGAERFWAAVAEAYPEIETGDFPPDAMQRLETTLTEAVDLWLMINTSNVENDPK